MRSFELCSQIAGVLLSLIELGQFHGLQPLALVVSASFDSVVVDSDALVRIANRQIHRQIVVRGAVVDVELGERGLGDVKFDSVGAENQPEDEDDDSDEKKNGEDDLADAGADAVHEAAAAAAEGVAAAAAAAATSRAVGGFGRRGDGGAVVGSVEVRLPGFSH